MNSVSINEALLRIKLPPLTSKFINTVMFNTLENLYAL